MANQQPASDASAPALQAYLIGMIGFEDCQQLQHRLVESIRNRTDGQIQLLVCEHPPLITIGRGSPPHSPLCVGKRSDGPWIDTHWVKRGGGCLFHAPGQLSVYPIVPLQWHGFTIGEYLRRLESAVRRTLRQLGVEVEQGPAFAGRTGSLAALGVTVRDWVAYNGAFISVSPPVALLRFFDRWSPERNRVSCLVAERQGPVRMATVRAEIVRQVAQALGCDRYHLHTGHPLLKRVGSGERAPGRLETR